MGKYNGMLLEKIKLYAACPICGHKICKAESPTTVEILCHKCGKLVRVEVKNDTVHTRIIEKTK